MNKYSISISRFRSFKNIAFFVLIDIFYNAFSLGIGIFDFFTLIKSFITISDANSNYAKLYKYAVFNYYIVVDTTLSKS